MKKSKVKSQKLKFKIGIFILGFLIFPLFANAILIENNNTEVINEIKVEASTGNNKIEDGEGEIIEDESKSSVEIKTIINGEEVESISTQSDEGSIKIESRVEANDESVSHEVEVVSDEDEDISHEVEVVSDEDEDISHELEVISSEGEARAKVFQNWWLDLVENLKTIFLGIFNIFS